VDVALLQVVWEHADRLWLAGDVMCRLLKYAQSFAIMSSVNMLVVLSVDRHQAIRRPLRPPPAVRTHQSINQSRNATSNYLATSRGLHVARQQQLSIDICCGSAPDLGSKPAG